MLMAWSTGLPFLTDKRETVYYRTSSNRVLVCNREVVGKVGHSGGEEDDDSFEERFEHRGKTWAMVTHRQFC